MNDEVIYVYRGVHAAHPGLDAAKRGIVYPADSEGELTPLEHNVLGESGISQFTSWTFYRPLAEAFAKSHPGRGVVLRLPFGPPAEDGSWQWVESPDRHNEREVLLKGRRMDAEVI